MRVILLFAAGLAIVVTVFPAINRLCRPVAARNRCNRIKKRWLNSFGRILNLHVEIEGQAVDGPAVIISNHISWLDIIVLGQHLPGYFVAKSDILSWPVIGFIARQVGTIFVARGDKQSIHGTTEQMSWLLKQNSNVFAFPEGTTTDGSEVLPFHSSLLQPALLTRSAIQPISLQYQREAEALAPFIDDDEFVPHLLKMLRLDSIHVRLKLLLPLDCAEKNRQQLSREARASIHRALELEPFGVICPDPVPIPARRRTLSGS
ncbi:MAG: lysophospholipid acyltransferase family protein [Gammaproteobacteria bacterium]